MPAWPTCIKFAHCASSSTSATWARTRARTCASAPSCWWTCSGTKTSCVKSAARRAKTRKSSTKPSPVMAGATRAPIRLAPRRLQSPRTILVAVAARVAAKPAGADAIARVLVLARGLVLARLCATVTVVVAIAAVETVADVTVIASATRGVSIRVRRAPFSRLVSLRWFLLRAVAEAADARVLRPAASHRPRSNSSTSSSSSSSSSRRISNSSSSSFSSSSSRRSSKVQPRCSLTCRPLPRRRISRLLRSSLVEGSPHSRCSTSNSLVAAALEACSSNRSRWPRHSRSTSTLVLALRVACPWLP